MDGRPVRAQAFEILPIRSKHLWQRFTVRLKFFRIRFETSQEYIELGLPQLLFRPPPGNPTPVCFEESQLGIIPAVLQQISSGGSHINSCVFLESSIIDLVKENWGLGSGMHTDLPN